MLRGTLPEVRLGSHPFVLYRLFETERNCITIVGIQHVSRFPTGHVVCCFYTPRICLSRCSILFSWCEMCRICCFLLCAGTCYAGRLTAFVVVVFSSFNLCYGIHYTTVLEIQCGVRGGWY